MMKRLTQHVIQNNILEFSAWLLAFVVFASTSPSPESHFSLCPLNAIGFESCPGCGMGRSMTYLFHGDIYESWRMHFLGIPAALLLSGRIIYLFRRIIKNQKRLLL